MSGEPKEIHWVIATTSAPAPATRAPTVAFHHRWAARDVRIAQLATATIGTTSMKRAEKTQAAIAPYSTPATQDKPRGDVASARAAVSPKVVIVVLQGTTVRLSLSLIHISEPTRR